MTAETNMIPLVLPCIRAPLFVVAMILDANGDVGFKEPNGLFWFSANL
jgi:hypothetical protein